VSSHHILGRYGWFIWNTGVTWPTNPFVMDIHIWASVIDSHDMGTYSYDLGAGQTFPLETDSDVTIRPETSNICILTEPYSPNVKQIEAFSETGLGSAWLTKNS